MCSTESQIATPVRSSFDCSSSLTPAKQGGAESEQLILTDPPRVRRRRRSSTTSSGK